MHKARIGRRAIDRIAKTAIRRDDNRALPDRHGKVQAIADRVAEFQGQVGGAEQVAVHGVRRYRGVEEFGNSVRDLGWRKLALLGAPPKRIGCFDEPQGGAIKP